GRGPPPPSTNGRGRSPARRGFDALQKRPPLLEEGQLPRGFIPAVLELDLREVHPTRGQLPTLVDAIPEEIVLAGRELTVREVPHQTSTHVEDLDLNPIGLLQTEVDRG